MTKYDTIPHYRYQIKEFQSLFAHEANTFQISITIPIVLVNSIFNSSYEKSRHLPSLLHKSLSFNFLVSRYATKWINEDSLCCAISTPAEIFTPKPSPFSSRLGGCFQHVRTGFTRTLLCTLWIQGRRDWKTSFMWELLSSLEFSTASHCSLCVYVAAVTNLLFRIWANNIECEYAVDVFAAIQTVRLHSENNLYIRLFFRLVWFRTMRSLQSHNAVEIFM